MKESYAVVQQINDLRGQLKELQAKLISDANAKAIVDEINSLDKKAAELVAIELQWPPVGIVSAASLNGALGSLLNLVEGADSAPTAQAVSAFGIYRQLLDTQLAKWTGLKARDLAALNALLQQRQMPAITVKN
jgi:BioD-like phosphotransacetylase family protein